MDRETALAIGCLTRTLQRVAKEIQPLASETDGNPGEYQRLFGKMLPIRDRVELCGRIAHKVRSDLFAAMRAWKRADEAND